MKELLIDAVIENLDEVLDFVNAELKTMGCALKTQHQIAIAVEEVFVNIANYAYNPGKGPVLIRMKLSGDDLEIVVEDSGKPYNPLEQPEPDIKASANDRPIGGLGVFMVKKIMDTIEYLNENGTNKLIMTKVIR